MDDYDLVQKSSLKFKGQKRKRHKHKSSDNESGQAPDTGRDEKVEDAESHGDWWKVDKLTQIRDNIAIEFVPGCYARSMPNGTVILGQAHPPGDGPDEEEIFTGIQAGTNQIAIKSGFGRYLAIDARKRLMGLSEAIGEKELFLPVFEDGKLAICAYNDNFLSPDLESDDRPIVARSEKAEAYEFATIRVQNNPNIGDKRTAEKLQVDEYEAELGYLKNMQSKSYIKQYLEKDKRELKKAKAEGQLHEALLDKRTKQKSDKYCK